MIQLHQDQVNFQHLTHLAIYVRLCPICPSLASLFPKELDSYRGRVDDVSDDESEQECDDDTTVCDDDVTGTNGEVANADDDGVRNLSDLFNLFKQLYCNILNV